MDASGSFSSQAYFFDYDLDGDLDMFLLNYANMFYSPFFNVQKLRDLRHPYFGNKMYRNDDGKFSEVTDLAGIPDYEVPGNILENGKGTIRVKIEAKPNFETARIFEVRLLK